MTPDPLATSVTNDRDADSRALLDRIAFLGSKPFASQVVQSPWNEVVDAASLHREVKIVIKSLVDGCTQANAIRCLTVAAPAGYGKTHLLSWTRQMLDAAGGVFIYVPPFDPGNLGSSMEGHVVRSTADALWSRSLRQKTIVERAVRKHLLDSYHFVIDSGSPGDIKDILRTGGFWGRRFGKKSLRIDSLSPQAQLVELQRVLARRPFLERAFADFSQRHPVGNDGERIDWDTFVSACLQACGDSRQRWHAERWFAADRTPLDVLKPLHIDHPCQGADKARDALFTLKAFVGQRFCLAFDQFEDTSYNLNRSGQETEKFWQRLSVLLRRLGVLPDFCMVFCFQFAEWTRFNSEIPHMLRDRMTEGHGVQRLHLLEGKTACELVQHRMRVAVWDQLKEDPPINQPHFPFTAGEIERLSNESKRELRAFLQRVQQEFDSRILSSKPQARTALRAAIRLLTIEPREVISHEPTAILIRGENLPPEVRVTFDGQPSPTAPACRPSVGEIDVTSPVGLVGDIEVRVEAAGDQSNVHLIVLRFVESELPRPYRDHIDGRRLSSRRLDLKLTQSDVAARLLETHPEIAKLSRVTNWPPYIGKIENGRWSNAPDDIYIWLAELYDRPLSSFARSSEQSNG